MTTRPTSTHRPGFTLVELMMTVGIIAILAAVLVVALGRAGEKAREEATRALITKVAGQVQERLEAFDRLKSQPQWTSDAKLTMTIPNRYHLTRPIPDFSNIYPKNPNNPIEHKVLLHKYRIACTFPQSFDEFAKLNPAEFIRMIDPQNTYGFSVPTGSNEFDYSAWSSAHTSHQAETEGSAILYYVLTNGQTLGIPTVDAGEFKTNEVRDTDGDGLVEFIDAWERPLRFYRWPTRLVRAGEDFNGNGSLDSGEDLDGDNNLDGPGTGSPVTRTWATLLITSLPARDVEVLADQDDPTNALLNRSPQAISENDYHTPQTYHQFLLVSGGPDGRIRTGNAAFGLYLPNDQYVWNSTTNLYEFNNSTTNYYGYLCQPVAGQFDAMTDNITNRNRP